MSNSSLVIPVALWGKNPPTHSITCLLMTANQKHVVTGSNDGQLCVWDVDSDWTMSARMVLYGHSSTVTCLAVASTTTTTTAKNNNNNNNNNNNGDNNNIGNSNDVKNDDDDVDDQSEYDVCETYFVSSSDNGEMCLWDISDGRCIESIKSNYIHTHLQNHQLLLSRQNSLLCNGFYSDILIMDPLRLTVTMTLSSNIQSDWVTALCVLRPVKKEDDVVVAITNSGLVKVWSLPVLDRRIGIQLYENESKPTRCLNARALKCCIYNQRTVLIVCTKYWQVYDTSDFSPLCSESSRLGERWMGGEFISSNRVIVWSNMGRGYLYQLPSCAYPSHEDFRKTADLTNQKQARPIPYLLLDDVNYQTLDTPPSMLYLLLRRQNDNKVLLRGDFTGRLAVWLVSGEATRLDVSPMSGQTNGSSSSSSTANNGVTNSRRISEDGGGGLSGMCDLPVMNPKRSTSISDQWKSAGGRVEGIIDHLASVAKPNIQAPPSTHVPPKVTSSIYMASCYQVACGRSDGAIVIVSAIQALSRLLFQRPADAKILPHKKLHGHRGRVNCLLYPNNESPRYEANLLVSGGQDFCVFLWDIFLGVKLHCFCVHGGEILQLMTPPDECNTRVLQSICSVASDHSLSLLSLRDRKCILLASRQLFPVVTVKWRPYDDFVVVGCSDGSVYVWQMETGHLDRVSNGSTAEDILSACDEKVDQMTSDKAFNPQVSIGQALRRHNVATFKHLAKQHIKKAQNAINDPRGPVNKIPHPSLIQRPKSLSAMLVQGLKFNVKDDDSHVVYFNTEALIVQLLSAEFEQLSPNTLESLGFYTRVANGQDLSGTQKMLVDIFSKVKSKVDDVSKNIQSKVDTAAKLTSNQSDQPESSSSDSPSKSRLLLPSQLTSQSQTSLDNPTLLISQILMSCLHAWEMDLDVDKLCLNKLGLLKPVQAVSFGYLSPGGQLSLLLPTAKFCSSKKNDLKKQLGQPQQPQQQRSVSKNPFLQSEAPPKHQAMLVHHSYQPHQPQKTPPPIPTRPHQQPQQATRRQSTTSSATATTTTMTSSSLLPAVSGISNHWQISNTMTTQHLLSIISLSNTLMSMSNANFTGGRRTNYKPESESVTEMSNAYQSQNKQGWSLLAALHCVLLPDLVGRLKFKAPQLELLAKRWQDRCLEIREASQALLLAELRRLGPQGRKRVVDEWSPYLPTNVDPIMTLMNFDLHSSNQVTQFQGASAGGGSSGSGGGGSSVAGDDDDEDDDGILGDDHVIAPFQSSSSSSSSSSAVAAGKQQQQQQQQSSSSLTQQQQQSSSSSSSQQQTSSSSSSPPQQQIFGGNKQATAIVMLGVVGAEFGANLGNGGSSGGGGYGGSSGRESQQAVADGFSVVNHEHARNTSKALAYLLFQQPTNQTKYSLIRRASVDLIGRGFVVWQPYLDVSNVLIGLLELCIDADRLVPSMTFGLPLTPRADACRTARHALSLIATARPSTYVITMAKEVARYNAMIQNAQSQAYQHSLHAYVLVKSKPEILRVLQQLVEKMAVELMELLSELTDVMIHCLDMNQIKTSGLQEIFPGYCKKFPMVSYCHSTRRIVVGTRNGNLLFYDLKQGKCQSIAAHRGQILGVGFSADGKFLASIALADMKVYIWQTASSSMFSLGPQQIKCVKGFTVIITDQSSSSSSSSSSQPPQSSSSQPPPQSSSSSSSSLPPSSVSPLKVVEVKWHDQRTVAMRFWNNSEIKYRF